MTHFTNPVPPTGQPSEANTPSPIVSGGNYSEYVEAAMGWAVIFVSAYGVWAVLP